MSISPAFAQEKILRTLTVTGQGEQRIPATIAQVELGVEIQGNNAATVQQEVAKRSNAVIELLRNRNVQQLKTTGIRLQPNYDYSNNQRRLIGYVGVNTVSFRFPVEQVGVLLDDVIRTGATRIDNISLTASESAITQAQRQALQQATADAQQQAEVVLKSLNLNAKEIVSISINGANVPQPRLLENQGFAAKADAASTPVVGGEQTVNASVTLQISY
nr:SIMPL domain-containing protein [Gloeothece verrucosa]